MWEPEPNETISVNCVCWNCKIATRESGHLDMCGWYLKMGLTRIFSPKWCRWRCHSSFFFLLPSPMKRRLSAMKTSVLFCSVTWTKQIMQSMPTPFKNIMQTHLKDHFLLRQLCYSSKLCLPRSSHLGPPWHLNRLSSYIGTLSSVSSAHSTPFCISTLAVTMREDAFLRYERA